MAFATIAEIIDDIRAGRMVVILDDEDRENEGDLVMAAQKVRAEDVNFMVREARGLVCLSLTAARCTQLGLKPMVLDNTSPHHTNFTVSIEAAEGVTTGISAHDRAHTIRTAVAPDARPAHLSQPGHIFPLTAQPGGVLVRAGHTEAASDLAALAGLEPAGVLVEILAEDGTMARRPELEVFAAKHGLEGLSKVTALEGGPHGVTSNCINPSYVRTPLVEKQIADQARTHGIPESDVVEKVMLAEIAIRRLVEPEEVADLALWLAGDTAGMVTGASYTMDGGWTAR